MSQAKISDRAKNCGRALRWYFMVFVLASSTFGVHQLAAETLTCDQTPYSGFFGVNCREMLQNTVNEILAQEALLLKTKKVYARKCSTRKKRELKTCRQMKRKISTIENYQIVFLRNTILANQLAVCRCDEITDTILGKVIVRNPGLRVHSGR